MVKQSDTFKMLDILKITGLPGLFLIKSHENIVLVGIILYYKRLKDTLTKYSA